MTRHIHVHLHGPERARDSWDESKHPRKPNGEFGRGGSAPANAHPKYKPKEQQRAKTILATMPDGQWKGEKETKAIFGHAVEGKWNYPTSDREIPEGGEVQLIALSHLIPTQGTVETKKIEEFLGNKRYANQGRPVAIRDATTGKYYLQDGHHRVSADLMAGRKTAEIEVVTVKGPGGPAISY